MTSLVQNVRFRTHKYWKIIKKSNILLKIKRNVLFRFSLQSSSLSVLQSVIRSQKNPMHAHIPPILWHFADSTPLLMVSWVRKSYKNHYFSSIYCSRARFKFRFSNSFVLNCFQIFNPTQHKSHVCTIYSCWNYSMNNQYFVSSFSHSSSNISFVINPSFFSPYNYQFILVNELENF